MVKVRKLEARIAYQRGRYVYLLPSKAVPGSIWISPTRIHRSSGMDFDKIIQNYSRYNCSKETGARVSYYID